MNRACTIIIFAITLVTVRAQSLTEPQQKAINNYISLANHLTEQVNGLGQSLVRPYSEMIGYRNKSSRPIAPYVCRTDAKEYYFQEAQKTSAAPPTSFTEEEKITKVIDRLKSEGKTDGNAGIKMAYQVADKNYIRGGNNRIILATDGEFPIGNPTFDLVKKFAREDISISVFNFGKSTTSAKNLKELADLGKGNYEYITRENVDMKLISEVKAKKKK